MIERLADIRAGLGLLADLPEEAIDLTETALALAALERPGRQRAPYRRFLRELADHVSGAAGAGVEGRRRALAEVFAMRYGFLAEDEEEDDLDDANLMRVIERRRGLPVAVGILFLDVCVRLGWPAHGLSFPGRFLLRLDDGAGERIIVDPCNCDRALDIAELRGLLKLVHGIDAELVPGHYEPLGTRAILVRLQNELKMLLLKAGRVDRALAAVQAALLFAPEQTSLWREAGMMHLRLGDLPGAVAALEQFLARTPDGNAAARHRIAVLLQELRGRMN